MKKWVGCLVFVMTYTSTFTQINTGLYLYPDVSKTQIVFTYANDLWIIAKDGGTAVKLSSAPGVELFPKFSTDGKRIAFNITEKIKDQDKGKVSLVIVGETGEIVATIERGEIDIAPPAADVPPAPAAP